MANTREGPPRISPVSDFFGAVVPPTDNSCTGLITHPATDIHYVNNAIPGTTGELENATQTWKIGSSGTITQTDAFAQAATESYKALFAGYYSLELAVQSQLNYVGTPTIIQFFWHVYINGVEWGNVQEIFPIAPANLFHYWLIPIIHLNLNDLVTVKMQGIINTSAIWAAPRAGSDSAHSYCLMKYIGS